MENKPKTLDIYHYGNGMAMVFHDGKQIPEFQGKIEESNKKLTEAGYHLIRLWSTETRFGNSIRYAGNLKQEKINES